MSVFINAPEYVEGKQNQKLLVGMKLLQITKCEMQI